MKWLVCCSLAFMVTTSVAFAQQAQPSGAGEENGTGLGHQFPSGPPGITSGNAAAPSNSAPGAPAESGVCGPIVGGGVNGPSGSTAAGSANNPGLGEEC